MQGDSAHDLSGTIAVVAPHMDDELIGCGGILATDGVAVRSDYLGYSADANCDSIDALDRGDRVGQFDLK